MSNGESARTSNDPIEQLAPLQREAQAWVARFASGKATSADMRALKRWHRQSPAHAKAFSEASRLWDTVGTAGERVPRQADWALHSRASSFAYRPLGRRAALGGALAASAATVAYGLVRPPFGLWPSLSELQADYRTATGERKRITLASGVAIDMSAETSIAVRLMNGEHHYELIAGEAAISTETAASEPFILIAGNGRTIASRASFDVRYIGASACVTCLDGALRVEHNTAATALQPQEQLLYSSDIMSSVRSADPAVVTAWRDGYLVFHATPLAQAVEEVNRYRPGKIIVVNEALGRRLFNARFRIDNVDEVVDQVRQVFDTRVTVLPGGIVLLG
jgi:transmembrane sensor